MGARSAVRAPTNAPVSDILRVPSSTKALRRALGRLSKVSLVDLALEWLEEDNQRRCAPYLAGNRNLEEEIDEDYLWTPAETIEELRLTYNRMRLKGAPSRSSIMDRILDGDWRRGLSLYQLATIDFRYLQENDDALRWTALKLVPHTAGGESNQEPLKKKRRQDPAPYPTILPATFLRNLQQEIAPLVKTHYSLYKLRRHQNLPIIRMCVAESPYASPRSSNLSPPLFTESSRLIFIALPDSCPYIYISVSGIANSSASERKKALSAQTGVTYLKQTVLEQIPKAFGKSQHRYSLESTCLTARSLSVLMALRGHSGTNAANGIYTIFGDGIADNCPLVPDDPSFAQKVLAASRKQEDRESQQGFSRPAPQPRQDAETSSVLAEKSANLSLAQSAKSEDDRPNLKLLAASRFGTTGLQNAECPTADAGLDRLHIRLDEHLFTEQGRSPALPASHNSHGNTDIFDQRGNPSSAPTDAHGQASGRMTLTFQGGNVFLGLRKLFELGTIKTDKMPSWMTGEEAISGGTVKEGTAISGKAGGA